MFVKHIKWNKHHFKAPNSKEGKFGIKVSLDDDKIRTK